MIKPWAEQLFPDDTIFSKVAEIFTDDQTEELQHYANNHGLKSTKEIQEHILNIRSQWPATKKTQFEAELRAGKTMVAQMDEWAEFPKSAADVANDAEAYYKDLKPEDQQAWDTFLQKSAATNTKDLFEKSIDRIRTNDWAPEELEAFKLQLAAVNMLWRAVAARAAHFGGPGGLGE